MLLELNEAKKAKNKEPDISRSNTWEKVDIKQHNYKLIESGDVIPPALSRFVSGVSMLHIL
jgi:hypothetical protein